MNKVIDWQNYFIGIAQLSALRSKDPRTQVGCCIVDPDKKIILSIGYNGFPRTKMKSKKNNDSLFPWTSDALNILNKKDMYVVHAEMNAILNSRDRDLEGAVLYTTLFPCNECAKAIIQAGIKEVFYLNRKNNISEEASIKMFDAAGVKYKKIVSTIGIEVYQ